jgi:RNA polymerase sigma-70 factor, ECF subfamily
MPILPLVTEADPSPSDDHLLIAVAAGDESAFRILYRRHTPLLHRVARRVLGADQRDLDDILQETWSRALRGLGGFRRDAALSTWLCGIAVRVAREALRRAGRWLGDDELDRIALPEPDPPTADRIDLESAIAELPPRARTIVVLHDIEGFTHQEIAAQLGIADGTSKAALSRARHALRRRLGGTIE